MNKWIQTLILFPILTFCEIDQTAAKQFVSKNLATWLGWCTETKAHAMMNLVFEIQPEICVEIGVFGGSSLFPTAYALKRLGKGIIYAIDPWNNEEATKNIDYDDPNYKWWNELDFQDLYLDFTITLKGFKLQNQCQILRMPSVEAILQIPNQIDILHIDGNFTEESTLQDVVLYLPKVRKKGYIWVNDIHWVNKDAQFTKEKALKYLKKKCIIIKEYDNFILFQKK